MNLLKLISNAEYFKNYAFLFLVFFFISNLFSTKADANNYVNSSRQEGNNLEEFIFDNAIQYDQYDKAESQLKMFFGIDPENPGISFYQDSLIIDYSNYVREMYKLKLNDMTIKK